MNVDALRALEKAVEAGEFPADVSARDLGLDKEYGGLPVIKTMYAAFSNSIDAAMAFHNATGNWPDIDIEYRLCGGICDVTIYDVYGAENGMIKATSIHGPARALLLADIRALIAQAEAKGEGE